MKTFTNKKGKEFLLIEVPFGSAYHMIGKDNGLYFDPMTNKWISEWIGVELPKGNYQIIGLAKDVSESQATEIVDGILCPELGSFNRFETLYYDYMSNILNSYNIYKPKQSLSSLIQSLGLNNPLILEKK